MSNIVIDRQNWIFAPALLPAVLVALWAALNPPGPVIRPAAMPQAPVVSAQPASSPLPAVPAQPPAPSRKDFKAETMLELSGPLRPGDYVWDDQGVPDEPVRIVVDIKAQLVYVFRARQEIGRSSMIYGDDDKPTPMGIFPIIEKDADHHSSTYWGAPMPHMLKLTHDGISLHGSDYIDPQYATHGCVGLPRGFAATLFRYAKLQDYVMITRGWKPGA